MVIKKIQSQFARKNGMEFLIGFYIVGVMQTKVLGFNREVFYHV